MFEKNNLKIALDILYSKKEKIYPSYITKNNSNRENQVILLMIESKKRARNNGDFFCLNCCIKIYVKIKIFAM